MIHKYRVGQDLYVLPNYGASTRKAGACTVIKLLPYEGRTLQYRVQLMHENTERIVAESDLRLLDE